MRPRWLLACLMFLACPHRSEILRLLEPAGPPIEVGRYAGHIVMLNGNHPLARRAVRVRADVECHESVLRRIVRDRIEMKSPMEFQFMYAGYDSARQRLVIRYFTRHPDPTTIAGWQAQLVYQLPGWHLTAAYVQEVPLE